MAMFIIGLFSVFSFAASDITSPEVTRFYTDKTKYEKGETVKITVDIVEEETGVSDITFVFFRKLSSGMSTSLSFNENFDNPLYTGRYTFNLKNDKDIDLPLEEGRYELGDIFINDCNGNSTVYSVSNMEKDQDGNSYIFGPDFNKHCYIPKGVMFTVGETVEESIYLKSISIDSNTAVTGSTLPVTLSLDGGKTGKNYEVKLYFVCNGTGYTTNLIKFAYRNSVSCNVNVPEDQSIGKYDLTAVYIRSEGIEQYKTYSYDSSNGTLTNYDNDQCTINGNRYFIMKSKKGYTDLPVVRSVKLLKSSVVKPGIIRGEIEFDVSSSRIKNCTLTFSTKSGKRGFGASYKGNGIFEGVISSTQQEGEYYLTTIEIEDDDYNVRRYEAPFFSEIGYEINNSEGNQLFTYYDMYGEYKECYIAFQGKNTSVTVEGDFDIAFDSSLNDPNLITKINTLTEGETGRINISGDGKAYSDIFKAIKGKNVNLLFFCSHNGKGNYEWIFNGLDINDPKEVKLNVTFEKVKGKDYTADGNALIMTFANNGILPGRANFRIKSDVTYSMYNLHKGIYLYYFNYGTGNLDIEKNSGIEVYLDGSDKWCSFFITHNSKFLAAGSRLKNTGIPLAVGKKFKSSKYKCYFKVMKNRTVAVSVVTNKKIKQVVIPSSVKYRGVKYNVVKINSSAFSKCNNLRKAMIGKNVKKIGSKAFYNCPKLSKITIKSVKLKSSYVGKNAFGKINKKAQIKVPRKVLKKYKKFLRKKGLNGKDQKVS